MNVIDQPFLPTPTLLTQEKKSEAKALSESGTTGEAANSSNAQPDASQVNAKTFKYPTASTEEINAKNRRFDDAVAESLGVGEPDTLKAGGGRGRSGGARPTKPGQQNQTDRTKKPNQSNSTNNLGPTKKPGGANNPLSRPRSTGGSNGPGRAQNTGQEVAALQQNNAFPPVSPSAATTVRNAFLTAGTNNLVNTPFTVGQQMLSSALQKKIDAHAKMPGAEVHKPDGTKGTVDPAATPEQKMQARLTGAELNTETLTNTIILINEGPNATAVGAGANAPTDAQGRLTNLEKRMDAIEGHMPDIAKRYGLLYTPYMAPASSEAPTDNSRLENIEKRYAFMNTMIKKLVAAKRIEADAD